MVAASRTAPTNSVRILFGAALLLVVACDNPFAGEDCVSLGVFAIVATVTDGATHQAPSSTPSLQIVDGSYEELGTLMYRSNPPQLVAANERPGTYRVVVQAPGYRDFVQESVSATRGGECNYLRGVQLNVQLYR